MTLSGRGHQEWAPAPVAVDGSDPPWLLHPKRPPGSRNRAGGQVAGHAGVRRALGGGVRAVPRACSGQCPSGRSTLMAGF
jgi:hypothetical protein